MVMLSELDKEYHNKEFILEYIRKGCGKFALWELAFLGIKVDYDIALTESIYHYRFYNRVTEIPKTVRSFYSKYLSEDEIDKLITTLELLG